MTAPLIKHADRFTETAIDDEIVVMDLGCAEFFSLNATAGAVWRAIDGARTRAAVVAVVAAGYGLPAEDIAADVAAVIDQMIAAGFVSEG